MLGATGIYDVYVGCYARAGYIDPSGEAIVEIINGPCREDICIFEFSNATMGTRISPTTTTETITVITIATMVLP